MIRIANSLQRFFTAIAEH